MPIRIGRHSIGAGEPLFVIAELGLNHGGSRAEALALVDAAARAGASAVKLQTLHADGLVAPHCPAPAHVEASSLRDFFRGFELTGDDHRAIFARARAHGLAVMSTPFDEAAVALLERVGVDAWKIASGDVTHHRLIARVARTGLPVVISTGMSAADEIGDALACARDAGARHVVLLHCVSAYPTPAEAENLAAVGTLARRFRVPVGLSDHGTTPEAAVVAVALGASVYERHLVRGAGEGGVDAAVSSTPDELRRIVEAAARARRALGDGHKVCQAAEAVNRHASRRGLYAARDLAAGEVLHEDDLVALRPADGLDARDWRRAAGRRLRRAVPAGRALEAGDLEPVMEPVHAL